FGATFFVTEGFDFATNKRDYMTWDEIAQLHRDGFEIGNHTRDHKPPSAQDTKGTIEQLEAINARCLAHGIPRPVTFAYPGNALDKDVLPILHGLGIKFARRAGALIRVVRQVPRRQRLPGGRPSRPRSLRRSHRRPPEPLGCDRGPQGPAL